MTTGTEFTGLTRTAINALIAAYAAPISHEHAASASVHEFGSSAGGREH